MNAGHPQVLTPSSFPRQRESTGLVVAGFPPAPECRLGRGLKAWAIHPENKKYGVLQAKGLLLIWEDARIAGLQQTFSRASRGLVVPTRLSACPASRKPAQRSLVTDSWMARVFPQIERRQP